MIAAAKAWPAALRLSPFQSVPSVSLVCPAFCQAHQIPTIWADWTASTQAVAKVGWSALGISTSGPHELSVRSSGLPLLTALTAAMSDGNAVLMHVIILD